MAKPPPYPPKDKRVMRGKRKPSSMGKVMVKAKDVKVDPMDYVRPKPKEQRKSLSPVKPMPKRSAGIGETIEKPAKKKVNSGSTSARIRNMEKKYRRKLMEK